MSQEQTKRKALGMLLRAIAIGRRPVTVSVKIPVIASGDMCVSVSVSFCIDVCGSSRMNVGRRYATSLPNYVHA